MNVTQMPFVIGSCLLTISEPQRLFINIIIFIRSDPASSPRGMGDRANVDSTDETSGEGRAGGVVWSGNEKEI